MVYGVMLVKFRQSRKRMEAIQKTNDEDYTTSKLTFYQTHGLFRKKLLPEVPGLLNEEIQTLKIKSLESVYKTYFSEISIRQRKRRSSSVLNSLNVLVSHVRAATYILVLVTTLIVTWAPSSIYFLYEGISHLAQEDPVQPNSDVNMTIILTCLNTAFQNKECNMSMNIENYNRFDITETIRKVFHLQEAAILGDLLRGILVLINSMFNPVIYAFWYPDFRNYLVQIPHWWKSKKQISNKYPKVKS